MFRPALLALSLAGVVMSATAAEPSAPPAMKTALIIHGGAGVIERGALL